MDNSNANKTFEKNNIEMEFDFDEMEGFLSKQLEESFSDLELLENNRAAVSDPDSLGKVVLNEVWNQFGNQIGLDMTNETLIQKYDREHPETYKEVSPSVLKDEYTGKDLKPNEKANLDHVVPRKELFDNKRRKQANLSVTDLANKEENLKPTNEALNKSKGAKSNKEYVETREIREKALLEQNKKANKKVDESNKSNLEKSLQKEKNNKSLNDKLAADDDLMMQVDKEARKAINKDIRVNATKEVGKKAGKDALKTMTISALFSLSKEIMNGLIRFFKEKSKSFNRFLSEMKESIKSFFSKILSVLQTGASTLIGTIISEIFGPIVSIFKKLASLIKQGISSVIDAVNYLRDKKNKDKPFGVKVAQVGKIITVGLVGGSAIFLGEVFEKFLLTIPGMQIELPLIGTLANMIGLFLSSLVSGLVGAIVLNLIDKFIAKKLKAESDKKIIERKNEIMNLQQIQTFVVQNNVSATRESTMNEILRNHETVNVESVQLINKIFDENNERYSKEIKSSKNISSNQSDLDQMQKDLEEMQKDLEGLL